MSRHLGSLVLAAALLLTAAACSDDPPPDPEPSSDGSSGSQEPTTAPPSTVTTEPATPSVTPAAGLRVRQGHLSVRAPEGWSRTPEPGFGGFSEQVVDDVLQSKLFVGELPDLSGGVPVTLDEQARVAIRSGAYRRDPEILAPVELDGVEWYHTSGPVNAAHHEDSFGTIVDGFQFTLTLTTGIGILTAAEREELLASILATVELDVG